ncbi:MAG TPA: MOSC domain-containing protein [Pseudolabrys sp.]|nr:MOSC domain-containing protein [Pseudolabrys sp.]
MHGNVAPQPIVVCVSFSRTHTFSKKNVRSILLIENFGVEGDAHAGPTDQHLFHIRRYGRTPNLRQVHLIHSELFDELAKKGHRVCPGDLGENIVTRGVDLLSLPTGTHLKLGPRAVVEITGLRNPCKQIEKFQPGLLKEVAVQTPDGLVRKGGVMGIVLKGGIVKPNDLVEITLPPPPHQPLIYRVPGRP